MLVISHPHTPVALPQPSGPTPRTDRDEAVLLAEQARLSGTLPLAAGRTTRAMGRSTSMFHAASREAPSSSRSTTPSSSINSLHVQAALATPTSTVDSSSVTGGSSAGSTKGRVRNSEPVVEVVLPSTPKLDVDTCATTAAPNLPDDPSAIPYEVPIDVPTPPFARRSAKPDRDLARVWEAVAGARRITVICGAGISVSSPANIPDFRSTAGLFRKLKDKHPHAGLTSGKDLFDASLFNSSSTSSLFYSMIAELKAMTDAATPTTFHHFLKRLDLEGRLQRVYTQNIDGLEERAGLSFGLGETGDSRAALRALGKRKRGVQKEQASRAGSFPRSKSDSAVLFTQKQEAERRLEDEGRINQPMFPRTIPLHGSLSTLTCAVCSHKVYLSLASSGPQPHNLKREMSPDAPNQALAAMDLLSQGEAVSCVKCEDYERVRSVAGLRSRGVGIMKVDVVLYNGQNDGAEQVGDCVQRDILGLRDPNETGVPESLAERMARERKERKERESEAKREEERASTLDPIAEASTAEDAFASAFGEGEQGQGAREGEPSTPKKQAKAPRLKPLPPDLLIVAGTSLKVPGTKRIVREFAKACHARDRRVYPSSDESEEEGGAKGKTKTNGGAKGQGEWEECEDEEQEEDINAPIRTILLNYDFPVPSSQWDGVFDVWVQGNVQQSALGLWEASNYAGGDGMNGFSMQDDENHQLAFPHLSWSGLKATLDEERKAGRKTAARRGSSQSDTPPVSQQQAKQTTPKKATTPSSPAKAKPKAKAKATTTKQMPSAARKATTASKPKKSAAGPKADVGLETFMRGTTSSAKTGGGKKKSQRHQS